MKKAIAETIASIFPFWHKLDSETKSDFLNQVQYVNLSAGQFICLEGDLCNHLRSRYAADGSVVRGPAPLPLKLVQVKVEKNAIWISPWTKNDPRTGKKPWWI